MQPMLLGAVRNAVGSSENAITFGFSLNGLTLEASESSVSLLRFTQIFTLL